MTSPYLVSGKVIKIKRTDKQISANPTYCAFLFSFPTTDKAPVVLITTHFSCGLQHPFYKTRIRLTILHNRLSFIVRSKETIMAALVKSFLPLLLLVGVLSLLTVSTWAEDVNVTFVVEQRLESHGVLLISGNSSSLSPPRTMQLTPNDVWVLTVSLAKGVAYEYSVRVLPAANLFVCICRNEGNDPKLLTVPENYSSSYYAELVSGYDCNIAACPLYSEANPAERIRQGKDVTVTIVVPQHLENGRVLKIVGNSTELGNSNTFQAPVMTLTPNDIWVLTVTLTGGVTYELNVVVLPRNAFFECYCTPTERHVLSVPSEGEYHVEALPGYDCNNVACPRLPESKMFNTIRRVV